MANERMRMPFILNLPLVRGRKPASIPDTTQFSDVIKSLFGVTCATPTNALREGMHNEVRRLYLLHLNVPLALTPTVPRKVLIRLSKDYKTNSDISLESEVATLVFLRMKTHVPVPYVYAYCPRRDNILGLPFSVLSFIEGVDMNDAQWEQLGQDSKLLSVRDYARIIVELSTIRFDSIGSIYFKPGAQPPNCFQLGPVTWWKHESRARKQTCKNDRGPWRSSGQWIRAAVNEEIEFMERLPELANAAYGVVARGRWEEAKRVLPKMQDCIAGIVEDPLDHCATGPFVLGNLDLNPQNLIYIPEGPNAGRIVAVIDWEMSMTVPLWSLVCYPQWFDRRSGLISRRRDSGETQLLMNTYLTELQRLSQNPLIVTVVQNQRNQRRKRFSDVAILPWVAADSMSAWLEQDSI